MTEQEMKETMGQDQIMQCVLGKLYDILTRGDDGTPKSQRDFFCWATPGMPIDDDSFDFMSEGLYGKVTQKGLEEHLAKLKELGVDMTDLSKETVLNDVLIADAKSKSAHAMNFAQIVDFIPDTSGTGKDGLINYQTFEEKGTLTDLYREVLDNCSVKRVEIDEETQKRIDMYRERMFVKITKPEASIKPDTEDTNEATIATDTTESSSANNNDPLAADFDWDAALGKVQNGSTDKDDTTKTTTPKTKPTDMEMSDYQPWVLKYFEKQAAYDDALAAYADERANAMSSNNVGDFYRSQGGGASLAKKRVEAAMRDWRTAGFKEIYEKMAAEIGLAENAGMAAIIERYRNTMEHDVLTDIATHTDFYYTTLQPADIMKSSGWTEFTIKSVDYDKKVENDVRNFSSCLKTESKSFWHKHSTTNTSDRQEDTTESTITCKSFTVSFEMAQARIVRPWFHQNFFSSRNWKFKSENGKESAEVLSDGNIPPMGRFPAYPTGIIFVKNLRLTFDDKEDYSKVYDMSLDKTAKYSGSLKFGPWNLGVGGGYESHRHNEDHDVTARFDEKSQTITVKGMQIVGFRCHMLDKMPDPDPNITMWT